MINFIVYEKEAKTKNYYEMIILNFIGIREEKFKIFEYNNYHNKAHNRNIYILSTETIEEAIDIAKNIRKDDNWSSQIIIITDLKDINKNFLINKLLILDYIDRNGNVKNKLKDALFCAYNIFNKNRTLNFIINGEVNKIPYSDILLIEKSNNQNYCTIHTMEGEYIIKDTINHLEEQLDSAYFIKTHRSCIVNLYNIKHYSCSSNIVTFNDDCNKQTDLVAREKKKILKSRLIEEKIIE